MGKGKSKRQLKASASDESQASEMTEPPEKRRRVTPKAIEDKTYAPYGEKQLEKLKHIHTSCQNLVNSSAQLVLEYTEVKDRIGLDDFNAWDGARKELSALQLEIRVFLDKVAKDDQTPAPGPLTLFTGRFNHQRQLFQISGQSLPTYLNLKLLFFKLVCFFNLSRHFIFNYSWILFSFTTPLQKKPGKPPSNSTSK